MKSGRSNNTGIIGGLFWTFSERISAQLVSAIVGIILARLLMPEDYGVISIVMIFISFCDVFVTNGFGTALVQKKEVCTEDINTAFSMSFVLAIALYVALYLSAPLIAEFYKKDILRPVVRVLGLRIIITAVNTIQHAIIRRDMAFRKFFFATLIGTLISCVIGLSMAYNGYGVWALVAQYLSNSFIDTIILLIVGKWRPRPYYSKNSARRIFSFGGKVLATEVTFTVLSEISGLLVGKIFGASELAYYNQGEKYPSLIIGNVNSSIQEVMLPTYSKVQNEIEELKRILRKSVKVGIYVISPLLLGLFAVSDSFVEVILTEKWTEMIPFLKIWCLIFLTRPFESSCHQAVLGVGRSGTAFKIILMINVTRLLLTVYAIFLIKSVFWVALAVLMSTWVGVAGFSAAAKKLTGYEFREQAEDIVPSIAISGAMCAVVSLLGTIEINGVFLLIIRIIIGAIIYISLSAIFRLEPYIYLKNLLKEKLLKKSPR